MTSVCRQCGTSFESPRGRAYCSKTCTFAAWWARNGKDRNARAASAQRAWRIANRERVRQTDTARYRANKANLDAYRREWAKHNPARQRLVNQVANSNSAARQAGVPGRIRVRDIEHLPGKCVYCGATERLTIDHATPMSRGGENHWSNLTVACLTCNDRKGTRTVPEFLERVA